MSTDEELRKRYIEDAALRVEADRLHKLHEPGAVAWPALNCMMCLEEAARNMDQP